MPREDRKKWWFELKSGEVFIYRGNGPISHKGDELGAVFRIDYSEKFDDKVKVHFRNKTQPILLRLPTFDFSANGCSKNFKSSLLSPSLFSEQFNTLFQNGLSNEELQPALNSTHEESEDAGDIFPGPWSSTPINSSAVLLCPNSSPLEETGTTESALVPTCSSSVPIPQTSQADNGSSKCGPNSEVGKRKRPRLSPQGVDAVQYVRTSVQTPAQTLQADDGSHQCGPKSKGGKRKHPMSNPDEDALQPEVSTSDKEFEKKILDEMAIAGGKAFKVLTSNLCAPRESYKLRDLDKAFVKTLEKEMLERPLSFGRPLIAVVRGLADKAEFLKDELDSYSLEVIGGNHRREALQNILQDRISSDEEEFWTVDVQLFSEMLPKDVLRLAHLHNEVDKLHHGLSFIDKLCLFRRLLRQQHDSKKTSAWKEACALLTEESVSQLSYIFSLCDLDDEAFHTLIRVLKMYGRCELKGQKARKKDLESGAFIEGHLIDCPTSRFKCLRGDLESEELLLLLKRVESCDYSLTDMQREATKIKDLKEVKTYVLRETSSKNWKEVQMRFPKLASEGFLKPYCGQIKRGGANDAMKDLVKRCLSMEAEEAISSEGRCEGTIVIPQGKLKDTRASVVEADATTVSEVVTQLSHFTGCGVVFLDLPKGWTSDILSTFFRSIKSINLRKNVSSCVAVVFATETQAGSMAQLNKVIEACKEIKSKYEVAFYHDSSKKFKVGKFLTNTVTPMVICHLLNQFLVVRATNCFTYGSDDGAKPVELYKQLLELYGQADLSVIDASGANGSAAVACANEGFDCVVLQRSGEKVTAIKSRLLHQIKDSESPAQQN